MVQHCGASRGRNRAYPPARSPSSLLPGSGTRRTLATRPGSNIDCSSRSLAATAAASCSARPLLLASLAAAAGGTAERARCRWGRSEAAAGAHWPASSTEESISGGRGGQIVVAFPERLHRPLLLLGLTGGRPLSYQGRTHVRLAAPKVLKNTRGSRVAAGLGSAARAVCGRTRWSEPG